MCRLPLPFLKLGLGRSDRGDVQNVICKSKRTKIVCWVCSFHLSASRSPPGQIPKHLKFGSYFSQLGGSLVVQKLLIKLPGNAETSSHFNAIAKETNHHAVGELCSDVALSRHDSGCFVVSQLLEEGRCFWKAQEVTSPSHVFENDFWLCIYPPQHHRFSIPPLWNPMRLCSYVCI